MTSATLQTAGQPGMSDAGVQLFATMLRLRRFEEKAGMLFALGTLGTPCPLGIGQEAAFSVLAGAIGPHTTLLALQSRPALELVFGADPADALMRLRPESAASPAPPLSLLRQPGEAARLLQQDQAMQIAQSETGPIVVVVTAADDLPRLSGFRAPVLPVVVLPVDRKPSEWALSPRFTLRECDGADALGIADALAAARAAPSSIEPALAILTPPYAGHARSEGRRAASARDTADPVAILKRHLQNAGRLTDAHAAAIDTAVRDEITAAGRAVSLSCAP